MTEDWETLYDDGVMGRNGEVDAGGCEFAKVTSGYSSRWGSRAGGSDDARRCRC